VEVLVVGKEILGAAHTCMAEGGLNVALTDVNPNNNPEIHFKDTMEGGAHLNRGSLVRAMAWETPERVRDLERYGAIFDRDENGKIIQRFSGKQTQPHTAFVGDYTGHAIMWALVDQARRLGVEVWAEHFATSLLTVTEDGQQRIGGALILDQHSGELKLVRAGAVILCTGGGGRMYKVTTNAASNTADGFALALKVGAHLVDMEMVQFHPTGMITPSSMRGKLVTEGVRGEGGRLYNVHGERFMERYNPQRLELAGRDEVARSIFTEVQEGRGTEAGGVYLSVAHLPAAIIEERLPTMLEQFLAVGVDIRKEPMQIHPSMHHMMGGVRIDEWGATNVPGLYAAGEVAGGDHGGNRLGGNALASCQVMGRRAALGAANWAKSHVQTANSQIAPSQLESELQTLGVYLADGKTAPQGSPDEIHEALRDLMWANVGIKRTAEQLQHAQVELERLHRAAQQIRLHSAHTAFHRQWVACLELDNMLVTAKAIVAAASLREESRGAHFRYDFPTPMPAWERRNIVLAATPNGFAPSFVNQSES
jgi:fumarate reductase (CoM/CoB) subunit A